MTTATATITSRPTILSPLETAIAMLEGERNAYAGLEAMLADSFTAQYREGRKAMERAPEILEEAFAA